MRETRVEQHAVHVIDMLEQVFAELTVSDMHMEGP